MKDDGHSTCAVKQCDLAKGLRRGGRQEVGNTTRELAISQDSPPQGGWLSTGDPLLGSLGSSALGTPAGVGP